jgi:hypothetical protein
MNGSTTPKELNVPALIRKKIVLMTANSAHRAAGASAVMPDPHRAIHARACSMPKKIDTTLAA